MIRDGPPRKGALPTIKLFLKKAYAGGKAKTAGRRGSEWWNAYKNVQGRCNRSEKNLCVGWWVSVFICLPCRFRCISSERVEASFWWHFLLSVSLLPDKEIDIWIILMKLTCDTIITKLSGVPLTKTGTRVVGFRFHRENANQLKPETLYIVQLWVPHMRDRSVRVLSNQWE